MNEPSGQPRTIPLMYVPYKEGVIKGNTQGIEFLFKKNKVDYVRGWGRISAPWPVSPVSGTGQASMFRSNGPVENEE